MIGGGAADGPEGGGGGTHPPSTSSTTTNTTTTTAALPQTVEELQAMVASKDAEIALIKDKTKVYVTRLRADHDAVTAEKAELQVSESRGMVVML